MARFSKYILIFVLLFFAAPVWGATHYFADDGTDGGNPCLTSHCIDSGSPCKTIDCAEDIAATNNSVILFACDDDWDTSSKWGTQDSFSWTGTGVEIGAWYTGGNRVTSPGDIPGSCGARPIIDKNWTQLGRNIEGVASGATIQYLDVQGAEDAIRPYTDWIIEYNLIGRGTNKYGIRTVDSQGGVSGVIVRYNTFDTHCDYTSGAGDCTTETRIEGNGDSIPIDAINANDYRDDNWEIYGNYITDWFHSGIEIGQYEGDAPDNWEVYGNYIIKNSTYSNGFVDIDQGIAIKGNTNHKVHDNVMKNLGQGITVEGGTGHRIYRNIVVGSAFLALTSRETNRWFAKILDFLGINQAIAATPLETNSFHYKVQVVDTIHTTISDIVFQNNLSYGSMAKYAFHVVSNSGDGGSISGITWINNIGVNCGDDNEEYCFGTRDGDSNITHNTIYWKNNLAYNTGDTGNDCGAGSNEECIAKIEISVGVEDEQSITELNALSWNSGNIEGDPLLTSPNEADGDFTLQAGSPCKQAGLDVIGYEDNLISPNHNDIDDDWPATAAAPITYVNRNGVMDIGPYAWSDPSSPPPNKGDICCGATLQSTPGAPGSDVGKLE